MQNSKPILLVEDDHVDAMMVERALKDMNVTNPLVHKSNGEEALDCLRGEGSEKPCIILLDLNMPKMNGIEFLKIIKADEILKKIPVVVLTTSMEKEDIADSFRYSAAGYMVKAADFKNFVDVIGAIDLYWTLSESPNGD